MKPANGDSLDAPTIDPGPVNAWYGPQNVLLTVLMLSGFDGVTKPALAVRAANK